MAVARAGYANAKHLHVALLLISTRSSVQGNNGRQGRACRCKEGGRHRVMQELTTAVLYHEPYRQTTTTLEESDTCIGRLLRWSYRLTSDFRETPSSHKLQTKIENEVAENPGTMIFGNLFGNYSGTFRDTFWENCREASPSIRCRTPDRYTTVDPRARTLPPAKHSVNVHTAHVSSYCTYTNAHTLI